MFDELRSAVAAAQPLGREGAGALLAAVAKLKEPAEGPVSEDLFADLEIVLRGALAEDLKAGGAGVESLIQLTIGYAEAEAGGAAKAGLPAPPTGKLPFLLFEDLLEVSKLESSSSSSSASASSASSAAADSGLEGGWSARRAWSLLERFSSASLTEQPALFAKGKLVLLRLCNSLLRRLSKTLDTEWCGRVLMFLTAAYPLSERSAVNVKGEVNSAHATGFEDAKSARFDDADDQKRVKEAGSPKPDEDEVGEVGENGAASDGAAEDPARKDEEEEAEEAEKEEEEEEEAAEDARRREVEKALKAAKEAEALIAAKAAQGSVDYDMYSSLWGLQKWLAHPASALNSALEWQTFKAKTSAVLSAFEFYAFKEHELAQGREAYLAAKAHPSDRSSAAARQTKQGGPPGGPSKEESDLAGQTGVAMDTSTAPKAGGEGPEPSSLVVGSQCKYLTASRLLRLQLADPRLRMHLLTQLRFLLATAQDAAPNALAAAAKEAQAPLSAEDNSVLEAAALLGDILALEARTLKLLVRTPPNGREFASLLAHVVKREAAWTEWKDRNRCKAYERPPLPEPPTEPAPEPAPESAKKRKRASVLEAAPLAGAGTGAAGGGAASPPFKGPGKSGGAAAQALGTLKPAPTLEEHMEHYIDCDDPEQGVEAAYHAKHDAVYCWRATRLVLGHKSAWLDNNEKKDPPLLDKVSANLVQQAKAKKAAAETQEPEKMVD